MLQSNFGATFRTGTGLVAFGSQLEKALNVNSTESLSTAKGKIQVDIPH